ncbi:MAG: hypothetical protein IJW76_01895 [Clostridia bacterium]|nr:hypothetical protein [Clostridia bacterium]
MKNTDFLNLMQEIDSDLIEKAEHPKKIRYKKRIWASAIAACLALGVVALPLAKYIGGTAAPGGVVQGTTGGEAELPTVIKLGESGKFTAYELENVDIDTTLGANHKVEAKINFINGYFTDESKRNTTAVVVIDGKRYEGVYSYSQKSDYFENDMDVYKITNSATKGDFSINRETGVCVSFYVNRLNEPMQNVLTRDGCYEKVLNYLKNYIEDLENYSLIYEQRRINGYGYYFVFRRTIGDMQTSDSIAVGIRENGEIYTHLMQSLGAMAYTDISGVNMSAFDEAVNKKVDDIYDKFLNVNHTTQDIVLVKLKDGTYAFELNIAVEANKRENGKIYNDSCRFLVEID